MARHDATGRRKSGPPFVRLFYYLMDSPAWLALMPSDRAVLMQIMRRYNGENNGYLGASIDNLASECNIRPNTASEAVKRLIAAGFVEKAQEAAFSRKDRKATQYRLTCFKCDRTGAAPSNTFRRTVILGIAPPAG
ncbi:MULTISPECIES: winged helix-turn-helix domain-containing protein [Asticcacaulis]|uniref:winged helix-turn-helix domain-containing protein n=1 Tax=Asticcacaulis TaxID=76890 RepID=UPI001AE50FCB|nr:MULTISPECIES: winged helix-turn-helix domain-containing protein [Asticcacaulis]MBP2159573.1 putative transcriptional regulator [Asticcacaulis solisilvae]MDR6800600.1 putative transcriptional regulator [Asticcacaulis sp. BE141]